MSRSELHNACKLNFLRDEDGERVQEAKLKLNFHIIDRVEQGLHLTSQLSQEG